MPTRRLALTLWITALASMACSAPPESPAADAQATTEDVVVAEDRLAPDASRDASLDAAHDVVAPHDALADRASPVDADAMPAALPVPASLLHELAATPYVEAHCVPTTYAGWPYEAQRCTYGAGLVVTVADPSAMRVAQWIVDAAEHIAAVAALRTRDPANYEACLVRIARHTMDQSSRIFPLEGEVSEDVVYEFLHGVTYGYPGRVRTCSTCYCRVDSLTRADWCAYQAATRGASAASCLAGYGGNAGWNDAWANHCMANHQAAWRASSNEHYLAQAWVANNALRTLFPEPSLARGADVLTALGAHYPVY